MPQFEPFVKNLLWDSEHIRGENKVVLPFELQNRGMFSYI